MYYKLPSSERGKPRNGSSLFSLHVARERGLSCPGTMPPAGLQPPSGAVVDASAATIILNLTAIGARTAEDP